MPEYMPLAFFSMPGSLEWVVIALVALLLFGKRLPDVARSIGAAITELKRGLSGEPEARKKTAEAPRSGQAAEGDAPEQS